jgi:photosystem II stability/assembly factor-like uncharacterized protein
MQRSLLRISVAALVIPLLGAGCISFRGGKVDGGIYATSDRGEQWAQRGAIPTVTGSPNSLANLNITTIVQDPSDRQAFYVGTETQGAYYSWDGGGTWWALGAPFAKSRVDAIAVDPNAKCTIYVAAGAKAYKTSDCARSWRSSDFETTLTALAIDPLATSTLYVGNTKGDILKSVDGGASWRAAHRLDNRIRTILIASPPSGRGAPMIFAATQGAGMYRSVNGGEDWTDLRKGMEQFPAAFEYKMVVLAPDQPGTLLYASKYGILRSVDAGTTWQPLTLITAPGKVDIFSLAVNPKRSAEIAYATAATFYKSSDGGRSWFSKRLPTSRAASVMVVDRENGNALWMGTKKLEQ